MPARATEAFVGVRRMGAPGAPFGLEVALEVRENAVGIGAAAA
jgi:hypothetical protein